MGEMRNAHKTFIGKSKGQKQFRIANDIKVDPK